MRSATCKSHHQPEKCEKMSEMHVGIGTDAHRLNFSLTRQIYLMKLCFGDSSRENVFQKYSWTINLVHIVTHIRYRVHSNSLVEFTFLRIMFRFFIFTPCWQSWMQHIFCSLMFTSIRCWYILLSVSVSMSPAASQDRHHVIVWWLCTE